jgi:predicted nucleotidyltransferase
MERAVAIARLKQHEGEFKKLGVNHLYLFGSTARDEARDDSDVDLFFDHERGTLSLFQLMDLKEFAARVLGCRTEIMTRASLHPVLQERIEASALRAF